jgi:hypothetical protein
MEESSQRQIRCSTAAAIVSAGARAIVTGGWQSLPKVEMPGALLIGDTAGLLNVPKIKGTHQAIRSGMLAAEHLATSGKPEGFDAKLRASRRDGRAEESAQRQARLQARLVVRHGERGLGNRWWAALALDPEEQARLVVAAQAAGHESPRRDYAIAPCRRATASPASTSPPPNTMKTNRCISRWPTPTVCVTTCADRVRQPLHPLLPGRRLRDRRRATKPASACRSTPRTACTARPATSRILTRSSTG